MKLKKRYVVVDVETDSLNPSKLWVVVTKEYPKGLEKIWIRPDEDTSCREQLNLYLADCTLVGHNIIGFDLPVLKRFGICKLHKYTNTIDTLVCSRLRDSWVSSSHSLDSWGERLGLPKKKFNDFSKLTDEMVEYCRRDVEVTYRLLKDLVPFLSDPDNLESILLEHNSAELCRKIQENGFYFDISLAKELHKECTDTLKELLDELQAAFPPKTKLVREYIPKETKSGGVSRTDFRWLEEGEDPKDLGFYPGGWFSRFTYEVFNPASSKQRIEVLDKCGWKPKEKTKGHLKAEKDKDEEKLKKFKKYGWKVNEENLATLPKDAPEAARKLVQYIVLDSRRTTLEEWFRAFNPATNRIHGSYHHIGSWTHRKSHSEPNQANIPRVFKIQKGVKPNEVQRINLAYNSRMRECFCVPKDRLLIGTDAEGIQLRILAHYLDNPEYTKSIVDGKSEDKTDIHSVNQRALGLNHITRDHAKTFIYAWLLGAGIPKVAEILECSFGAASEAVKTFIERIDGLSELKGLRIPRDAGKGGFKGLDDRFVKCPEEYRMLAGYLQNGESVVMKWANRIWTQELDRLKLPYWQVNDVHDEWQTETINDYDVAKEIQKIQENSITQAGEELKLKVRLDGKGVIGNNWKETH